MYCVIQEIETRKFNQHGYHKELKVSATTMTISGETTTQYSFHYGEERFHRPIRKAYKISIHESKRVKGAVTKKQYAVTTVHYYELADDWFSLYDYADRKINGVAESLGVDPTSIYDLIEEKIKPLSERIQAEFSETEECKVHEEQEEITSNHALKKSMFAEKYSCDSSEYDYCFDVFGTLRNSEYLEKVKREAEYRKAYEERSRSYQKSYYSNYSQYMGSGLFGSGVKNENQDIFKKFYRTLSKTYHPDSNPDRDTSEEMKLLNQLKNEWGV